MFCGSLQNVAFGALLVAACLAQPACAFGPSSPSFDPADADADLPDTDPAIRPDAQLDVGPGAGADAALDAGVADASPPDAVPLDAESDGGAGPRDSAADPGPDAGRAQPDAGARCEHEWPYAPTSFVPCDETPPTAQINLSGSWTYDTDTGELSDDNVSLPVPSRTIEQPQGGPQVRFTSVAGFTLAPGSTLSVEGGRPWVVAVFGEARIQGEIEVEVEGQGNPCATPNQVGDASTVGRTAGGGGGGGGSANGGAGGAGSQGARGGNGGNPVRASPGIGAPIQLGCFGARGGHIVEEFGEEDEIVHRGGGRGIGGGALLISARDRLSVEGVVLAVGQPGGGGANGSGGGGGGAGGDIFLEAYDLSVSGVLCAGGASGGGGGPANDDGADGHEGGCSDARPAGPPSGRGGIGSVTGAGGGGQGGRGGKGGGGGGGSAGRNQLRAIRARSVTGTIQPNAIILPPHGP